MKKVLFLIIVTFITTNSFSSPKGQALAQSMGQFGSSLSGLGAAMMARQYENVPHLTNFDLAVPKFTDNEQNIIFTRGFFLNNSGDFYIAGNAVDSTAFLSELGFTDFLEKRDKFKKMNDFLGWTSLVSGLSFIALPVIMEFQDDYSFSNPLTYAAIASGAVFVVTFSTGLVKSSEAPSFPPFDLVSNVANNRNREMLE